VEEYRRNEQVLSGFVSSKPAIFIFDIGRRDKVIAGSRLTGVMEIETVLDTMDGITPLPQ
jgi:hypothetical protein